jgi:CDGSH-type Zn-finger protein
MKKNNEKPSMLFLENGPIQVSGSVQILGQYGEKHTEEAIYLCRCGGSKNKPYCDGTHKTSGFKG